MASFPLKQDAINWYNGFGFRWLSDEMINSLAAWLSPEPGVYNDAALSTPRDYRGNVKAVLTLLEINEWTLNNIRMIKDIDVNIIEIVSSVFKFFSPLFYTW